MDYDQLLDLTTDLGCRLMFSGAEIYRVEESMRRLLNAYELQDAEVFAIPSCIIVSVAAPNGHTVTRMRRIGAHGTNIEMLEKCNDLCRTLCANTPPVEEAHEALRAIVRQERSFTNGQLMFAYGLAPMFFAPLFGGTAPDMLGAFVVGLIVGLFEIFGRRIIAANSFFRTAVSAAAASIASILLVRLGVGNSVDTVTISALMMLVPGLALTSAMREIMAGDTISSLSHMSDAILCAVAIALGAAVGISAARVI